MKIEKQFIERIKHHAHMMRSLHEKNGVPEHIKILSVEEFTTTYGMFFGENNELPDYVDRGDLAYVEGIAMGKELCFPVHHAWLVDEHGKVYDPTWTYAPGEALYYGVPFSDDYFFETIQREEYYGIITPGGMFNTRLMSAIDAPEVFLHPWFVSSILKA
jgi:hypothetical protein